MLLNQLRSSTLHKLYRARFTSSANVRFVSSLKSEENFPLTADPTFQDLLNKYEGRIFHSTFLEGLKIKRGYRKNKIYEMMIEKKLKQVENVEPLPIVLNQLCENAVDELDLDNYGKKATKVVDRYINTDLPFKRLQTVQQETRANSVDAEIKEKLPTNWLQDYELYDEEDDELHSVYGSPNPKIPVSKVPCYGCGSYLHCKDSSIPGYLPSELFANKTNEQLSTITCQRCHFLINYNTAINVSVTPEDYVSILSTIQDKFALAILMVDLLDFPCSIWPGIKDILGPKRPIFIVGNKVDLLPKDSPDYLNHIKNCLIKEAGRIGFDERFIKHVSLISATTGYGVEELITKLHSEWKYKGDVYLIGCTNVGKSSLFNALLGSDYCKSAASNLIQKATACPWPGTTMRMLKFPILRPSDHRIYDRQQRLMNERHQKYAEDKLRRDQANTTKKIEHATLIGHIGRTFEKTNSEVQDPFSMSHERGFTDKIFPMNENEKVYDMSKWCFDTPGVVQPDQILNLLTTDEILETLPKEMIRPRVFLIKPNFSLFVGGLARFDYLGGADSIRVIVYSSLKLPVTICDTKDAEEIYNDFLGSELFNVPIGENDRLEKWPKLDSKEIVVMGKEKYITACDVVLSSAGWIGVNLPRESEAHFVAWTPEKRGIYVREPSLLEHGMNLKGARIRHSLAYRLGIPFRNHPNCKENKNKK